MRRRLYGGLGIVVALVALGAGLARAGRGSQVAREPSERTFEVAEAGTVTVLDRGTELSVIAVRNNERWTVEVLRQQGDTIAVLFRNNRERRIFDAALVEGEIETTVRRATLPATPSAPTTDPSTTTTTTPSTTTTVIAVVGTTSTTMHDAAVRVPESAVTYQAGAAGSVTVIVGDESLALLDVSANPGWSFEVEDADEDRVRIEFLRGGDDEVEFRLEFHGDELRLEVK